MKYDELSDISTIMIEPGDEKAAVLDRVSIQTKPVVVVLPDQANRIFQQPADFGELRRVRRQSGTSIMLVITGSERLRQWARRHGFPVYTSVEACGRALARRDRLHVGRYASGQLAGFAPRVTRKLLNTEPLQAMKHWQDAATEDDKDDDDGWPGWEYARAYEYEGAYGYPHLAQGNTARRSEQSSHPGRPQGIAPTIHEAADPLLANGDDALLQFASMKLASVSGSGDSGNSVLGLVGSPQTDTARRDEAAPVYSRGDPLRSPGGGAVAIPSGVQRLSDGWTRPMRLGDGDEKSDDDGDGWPGWEAIGVRQTMTDTPAEGTWFPMAAPRVSGEWPPAALADQTWSAVADSTLEGSGPTSNGQMAGSGTSAAPGWPSPQGAPDGAGLPSSMEWFDLAGDGRIFRSPTDMSFFNGLDERLDAAPQEMRRSVTHQERLAARASRVALLEEGRSLLDEMGMSGVNEVKAPTTEALMAQTKTSHIFMLILVGLLLLGILGGTWFGYLLATAPALH